jgi:exosortase
MVLTIASTALLLLGPAVFRLLVLPIAFLFMASTISERLMILVTFPLQLLASQGAWLILSLLSPFLGYEVLVSGNTLEIITGTASIPLNVAEQCSGMRMVVAFLALAMAFALIACPRWWERIAMFLLAVPVAIFMNVVRVAVLGLASLIDPSLANGQAHMLIGTLLLVPALGLYMLGHWMLGRLFIDPAVEAQRRVGRKVLVKRAASGAGGAKP